MQPFSPPALLTGDHDCDGFSSGKPTLDDWLKHRALRNQREGASRTYVLTPKESQRVAAYYALAAGSVAPELATGAVRRNMPSPIPVVILARLALDESLQGQGIGKALLKDAVLRTVQAADVIGIRAMLVHALDNDAARFYRRLGFSPSPINDLILMLPLKAITTLA